MLTKEEILNYMIKHYPDEETKIISKELGISICAVHTIATRNGIHKSKEFLKIQHEQLLKAKEEKYLASIPNANLTELERNIIIGSILGDGSLSFSQRSRNAYYREHFSIKQKEYREWKKKNIHSMNFRIEKECHLKSPSHPIFTTLYHQFFTNGTKTITEENIKLLDHPIGLFCLFMDDGTLMINVNKRSKRINISPTVGISTLCFSKIECELLVNHLYRIFNITFRLCASPDGKGWTIKIYKYDEIQKFYNLILPYCKDIPSLKYKWDPGYRLNEKAKEMSIKYGSEYSVVISNPDNKPKRYSIEEEKLMCSMKSEGKAYKEIAGALGRSVYGIGYKLHQLKNFCV